ncbi:hypothetical protein NGTWS1803_09770 [Mycolicibacterium cyprinidarum]|nr:hypothetical protein NGTWS1803_09770 [Mycolicibacterium sp. NGTWS1803]
MEHNVRTRSRSFRYGIAAVALCVGLAAAPVEGVAWADPSGSDSTSAEVAHAGPANGLPANRTDVSETTTSHDSEKHDAPPTAPPAEPKDQTEADSTGILGSDADLDAEISDTPAAAEAADTAEALAEVPVAGEPETLDPTDSPTDEPVVAELVVAEPNSITGRGDVEAATGSTRDQITVGRPLATLDRSAPEEDSAPVSAAALLPMEVSSARLGPAEPLAAAQIDSQAAELVPVSSPTTVETTPPVTAQPLSPLAELLQLPGRLVNAVLQFFDITTSASGPGSPFNIAPINDLLFAAFRDLERLFGLDRTPTPLPAVPTLTYTGPTTTPTPTVAQFLNAAAAGYGLGTTPGGLVPFTVNGFQMSSTNIFTGQVASSWVTPEGQIIIAYQGTTGGTNLLFNPLIAITQLLTDLQVIFTRSTPWAFYDALHFARRVQVAATEQGFGPDDIFVTGHSLGGWEAQYVAQQIGLGGIGFESPGINTIVPGNGASSMFVNIETYGDPAPLMSTDLPGLQPFMPAYVPGGGSKPHYGSIVMVGDPAAATTLRNATTLWGKGLIGTFIFMVDFLGNFFQYHLPGVQAYHLDVIPDPGVVPWLGTARGPVSTGYGTLTIPQLLKTASDSGNLFRP